MEQPSLSWIPRFHPEAAVQQVRGRWVAATADESLHGFVDASGAVSEAGERIISLVDGVRSVSEVVAVLCEEFEVGREQCERETLQFLKLLVSKRVLAAP